MITKPEFDALAREFGASVVFKTACAAVFNGPRFCITIELNEAQMKKANALELANMMAHVGLMN